MTLTYTPYVYACSDFKGLEVAMMKSEASAEDILVSSMNRLGYGAHANSSINTQTIRNLEKTKGKRAAVNIIAAEIRASFKNLEDPSYFPYRILATELSSYPAHNPYSGGISKLKENRQKMIDQLMRYNIDNSGVIWTNHTLKVQQIRKIADSLNEKEFNVPGILSGFWFNHFNVQGQKAKAPTPLYELALKQKSCSTFYEMLLTSAKHPAMSEYLDNVTNLKGRINENYAREVIELHTLGSGTVINKADGTVVTVYSGEEIIEAAKILTGWNYNRDTYAFEFRANAHENGTKKFNILFKNQTVSSGLKGGEEFFKLLANHGRTKRHICRKLGIQLYGRHPGIPDVDKCVAAYGSDGNLAKMYEAYILSDEFWNTDKFFMGTKNPYDSLISALRGMGTVLNKNTPESTLMINTIINAQTNFGQPMYNFGAPTGFTQLNRKSTPSNLISNRVDVVNRLFDFTPISYASQTRLNLEKTMINKIKLDGTNKSYDFIVKDVAPVFPSFIQNNRQIASTIKPVLTNPDLQNNNSTPLKSSLLRLFTSGSFLRK